MRKSIFGRATFWSIAFYVLGAGAACAGWQSETVASAGDVGLGCALAADRWGRPHIAYYDKTERKIKYARFTGADWELETVAENVNFPDNAVTGIAVDAFDQPHIAFVDLEKDEITYGFRSGTRWQTERVDDRSGDGYDVSIAAWPTGPRVTYSILYGMSQRLKYATRDAKAWQIEDVFATGSGGLFNKLFIDNEGASNVVYFNSSPVSIRYALRGTNGWTIEDIEEGIECDAVAGPDSRIHVSFSEVGYRGLNYAVSTTPGDWKIENVTAAVGQPVSSQIAVNASGTVFITYYNADKRNLCIMKRTEGGWTYEVVATDPYVGLPHSTVISGTYPLIAYYDAMNDDLKLARYEFTGVDLAYFTAGRARGGVHLSWAVYDGLNLAGFNLYRAARDGRRVKVNGELITGASPFRYYDAGAAADAACEYWLEAVTLGGAAETFGPAPVPAAAKGRPFVLYQNTPNPCNATATFAFELPKAAEVKFAFFDLSGRKVHEAAKGYFPAGRHEIPLELTLPPGVYVYRLDAGGKSAARIMVVAR